MNRKIELAKKKKEILARQQELTAKEIKARQSLLDATKKLYDLINGQEQYDFTKLEKQLEKIDKSLDLSKYFTNLERSIKDNSPHAQVTKTKIQDFSKLLEAIAKNKPIPFSIDLTRLEKAVVNIEQYIQNNSGPSDQGAENYQPVRRVLKVGNRFIFDDNFTNAGGGGGSGGGDTNGLTDTELRASAVPVSVSGVATSAKQDTGNTSLASLDTKLPAQGQALAAASTPVVLPAAQITTLTPPAAITGYATASNQTDKSQFTKITDGTDTALVTASGEQNVLETNSAAIKTAVETIDNIVSGTGANISQVGGTNIDTNSGSKSAGTQRVVLATDQPQLTNALKVDGSGVTQPISGSVTAIAQPGVDIGDVTVNNTTANPVPVQPPLSGYLNVSIDQTGNNNAVDVLTMPTVTETNSGAIKTAVETIDNAVSGAGFNITQFAGTNNAVGSGTATGALRVELPTNGTGTVGLNAGTNAIGKLSANSGVDIGDVDVTSTVLPTGAGTSSVTSVADTTTSATLIASNSARKEVIITNDSSATLYVKYGTTASSTNYTVSLDRGDSLFEDRYTGRVDGIWATDPNDGAARITEIT